MKLEPSRESLAERSKDEKFFLRKYPRPAWLLEESDDFRWVFRRDVPGYAKSHYTVVWDFGEEHADLDLHRKRYWSGLARTLAICYGASTGEKSRRVTSIIVFARSIRSFALWACFVRQCSSASVLSDEDISAYERHVEDLGLTEKSAHQKLSVISAIWNFREELDEKILIRPYRFQGELGKAAKRVGRTNGHTPTLEPESFFLLLEHSLALIDQGEKWIDLAEQYSQVRSSGVGRPSRKFKSITGECASNVITMARDVYGACIVLIFSMLGARKHEVALFQVSDAREYLDASDGLLGGRVTKSSNGAGGSKTERPLIPELHQAIGFVVSLTGIDIQNDSGALFRPIALDATLQSDATDELDTGKIYRLVERIAQLANIRKDVRPHMFRRAFSMIYIWRYELGDLHYLSRMLKHNDLTHTIAYTQGDDIKIFLMDAERDLARSIMERALTGKELLGVHPRFHGHLREGRSRP